MVGSLIAAPVAAADATAKATEPAQAEQVVTKSPRGATLGSRAEEERYAKLEAASPEAQKYKAGDVIVISATAVAVILLVVLVLILL